MLNEVVAMHQQKESIVLHILFNKSWAPWQHTQMWQWHLMMPETIQWGPEKTTCAWKNNQKLDIVSLSAFQSVLIITVTRSVDHCIAYVAQVFCALFFSLSAACPFRFAICKMHIEGSEKRGNISWAYEQNKHLFNK